MKNQTEIQIITQPETLTCCQCGRKFRHFFSDAVKPSDIELRRHPLCNRCRCLADIYDILAKPKNRHPKG